MFSVPVLFIIFNRPDTTARVFEEIKKFQPSRLFIAADGPRPDRPEEARKCLAVRKMVMEGVNWECKIKTLFRDNNLGCRKSLSSAITWFFDNVEEGIILEDDCLPDPTFFIYCQELLEKYRNDDRIMHIGGANFQGNKKRGDGSYYFSKYSHIWGWATWRRAWKHYDLEMKTFPDFIKQKQINNICQDQAIRRYWMEKFMIVYENKLDTWDYQWLYAIWRQGGICIIPNYNLVTNIGFGQGATHTKGRNIAANKGLEKMEKITSPTFMIVDRKADNYYDRSLRFFYKLISKIKVYLHEV